MAYNAYPSYPLKYGRLDASFSNLCDFIRSKSVDIWFIDGTPAFNWHEFYTKLSANLKEYEILEINTCRIPVEKSTILLSDLIINESQFNKYYQGNIQDFFENSELQKLKALIDNIINTNKRVICIGAGCSLIGDCNSALVWLEIPRSLIQKKLQTENHSLFGSPPFPVKKSFEYIDSPVMRKYIPHLIEKISLYVDISVSDNPVFIEGQSLRENLKYYASRPFRTQPVFYPKAWGGQWLKKHLGVRKDLSNIAGSFEFAQKENDFSFSYNGIEIRIPIEFVISANPELIMGTEVHARFGSEFPLRLNLTDTIGGGDLSCQVHPTGEYTGAHFGIFTEIDEKYFIIRSEKNSKINLGLKENIDLPSFAHDVDQAVMNDVPFQTSRYMNGWHTEKGRVFFIPPGTIHNICTGNLVMEIISSNTLFTFRLYDYLREEKSGKQRPLQIKEAWQVLDSSKTTTAVKEYLIPDFSLKSSGNGEEFSIPQYGNSYTKINKVEISGRYSDNTHLKRFQLLTLVQGDNVTLEWQGGSHPINYLETILIPGFTGQYHLVCRSEKGCTVLKIGVI